ncbi:maleylacetate reductase [Bradyrhizobium sp. STM 3809]|uniref:maleylacetate reductase n=1 Tax=Bradyrhizobium sp. STM 3809 TaxID=551936 RepID=UPI00024070E3|nr:maleylacetate reductase [Bradyrhizobium sp. STM 3809]CCD99835.1 Maleylacetate reductase [Bradyrhizobium sp. STM 3809]
MTSTRAFIFPGIRSRVVFGAGTLSQLAPEMERLGRKRALLLATPQQRNDVDALADRLGSATAGVFAGAVMHTPVDVTREAVAAYAQSGADCVIALGGGSSIGLGKAIALRTGADQIAIPTTYAGSEMTDILGETSAGEKTTRRDPAILPETVIYDVDLTLSLPKEMTVASGLNAIAHAAEALYAPDRNPILSLMAADAVRAFAAALPVLVADPFDRGARADALYGAWLCGAVLGGASMSLHHKLCHTLGGSFDTPHAQTHAILLPHTIGFNAAVAGDLLAPISAALGGATPGKALHRFAARLGAPTRLRDFGLTEADLDRAAAIAVKNTYANPRAFGQAEIRALLQDAWACTEPPL